ncbi:hypothetical protein L5515_016373 [Caenorhabditis briggsae]|uniref:Uncharacterized protein n=1 Tax=Caenorhabditis briggsae TaxID=6238 RepID=A0AAE9F6F4_CAEBR|nr:hypothetical protein L5515_016373 [Caenorhabditis briggsae]
MMAREKLGRFKCRWYHHSRTSWRGIASSDAWHHPQFLRKTTYCRYCTLYIDMRAVKKKEKDEEEQRVLVPVVGCAAFVRVFEVN